MLQLIPQKFKAAHLIDLSILKQMEEDSFTIKTPISIFKNISETYALAITSHNLCFGIIQENDILFACYIPFGKDLYFQKIYASKQSRTNIIGFKLLYKNEEIEIFIKDKHAILMVIDKLSSKLTQKGFHQEYKPLRRAGKGGFATVYQVKRLCDGKIFAAKAFSKQKVFSKAQDRAMIQNEIELSRSCDHKNLLRLYQIYESDNSLYLVMQMYEGGDLIGLMKKRNAVFSNSQITQFMEDLFSGLKYLDDHNIMHRDMKPENVMIRNVSEHKKQLVIADFGLASKTNINKYLLERCGTPGYVAPEVANFKAGEHLTPKCDVFSLGVIFHIFLCKRHLFDGNDADEVYRKNKNLQFNLNDPRYDSINAHAMNLLKSMLVQNPGHRISAGEALQHPYFRLMNESKNRWLIMSPQSPDKLKNKSSTSTQTSFPSTKMIQQE